jgi:hypothetical protein
MIGALEMRHKKNDHLGLMPISFQPPESPGVSRATPLPTCAHGGGNAFGSEAEGRSRFRPFQPEGLAWLLPPDAVTQMHEFAGDCESIRLEVQ